MLQDHALGAGAITALRAARGLGGSSMTGQCTIRKRSTPRNTITKFFSMAPSAHWMYLKKQQRTTLPIAGRGGGKPPQY